MKADFVEVSTGRTLVALSSKNKEMETTRIVSFGESKYVTVYMINISLLYIISISIQKKTYLNESYVWIYV